MDLIGGIPRQLENFALLDFLLDLITRLSVVNSRDNTLMFSGSLALNL